MNLKACRGAAVFAFAACLSLPAWAATPVEETQTLISRGDLDGALKRIDRFLSSSPQDAEGRFTRALILVKQGKTPEAIKAFTDLTHDYPQLPEPYNNLAVLYAQAGDYEKARNALEAALATNPSYATAHENLGDIYAALAGAAYNRALALDQNNQTTRYKLSLINQVGAGQGAAGKTATVTAAGPAAAAPSPPAAAPAGSASSPAAATAPSSANTAVKQAAIAALDAWAAAWSKKDVETYLAAYAPDFQADGGVRRDDWEAQRRVRITKPSRISVKLSDPEVEFISVQHVKVTVLQQYQSDTASDKISKVFDMRDVGNGDWKIVRESIR